MCSTSGNGKTYAHAQGRECCISAGPAAGDEIRLLEEQKSDLAAIICRIDAKIEYLKRERS